MKSVVLMGATGDGHQEYIAITTGFAIHTRRPRRQHSGGGSNDRFAHAWSLLLPRPAFSCVIGGGDNPRAVNSTSAMSAPTNRTRPRQPRQEPRAHPRAPAGGRCRGLSACARVRNRTRIAGTQSSAASRSAAPARDTSARYAIKTTPAPTSPERHPRIIRLNPRSRSRVRRIEPDGWRRRELTLPRPIRPRPRRVRCVKTRPAPHSPSISATAIRLTLYGSVYE